MAQNKARTGKPALLKELNIGLIMDALQKKGKATRVELAAFTNLSQPTVNLLIGELVREQIVVSLGIAESTGGRRAELFALNGKRAALAAVIIKTDNIEAVVTDLDLHMELHEKRMRTKGISCTEELVSLLQILFEKRPEIHAVCVGVPGSVSEDGEVFSIPAVPEWEHFSLKEELESRFPVSVRIMNDMNAIAAGHLPGFGEQDKEHAKNFVYLHAEGAGTGAGIVIDGKLYSGFRSFAGEVGSMMLGTVKAADGNDSVEAADGNDGENTAGGSNRVKAADGNDGEKAADGSDSVEAADRSDGVKAAGRRNDADTAYNNISVEGHMREAAGHRQRTAILTAAAVNLICVLNPEEILFGGDVTVEMVREIDNGCRRYLPSAVLPRCRLISDYRKDYFIGLCRQGQEMLSRHIRLI